MCSQVNVRPRLRRTEKGHIEVDIVTLATTTNFQDPDWKNVLTVLIITGDKKKGGSAAAEAVPAAAAAAKAVEGKKLPERTALATWSLPASAGRSYGLLNGEGEK